MKSQSSPIPPASHTIQDSSDVPFALLCPSPGDVLAGLNERVDRDELPPRASYLVELITPAIDPSELEALKSFNGSWMSVPNFGSRERGCHTENAHQESCFLMSMSSFSPGSSLVDKSSSVTLQPVLDEDEDDVGVQVTSP